MYKNKEKKINCNSFEFEINWRLPVPADLLLIFILIEFKWRPYLQYNNHNSSFVENII